MWTPLPTPLSLTVPSPKVTFQGHQGRNSLALISTFISLLLPFLQLTLPHQAEPQTTAPSPWVTSFPVMGGCENIKSRSMSFPGLVPTSSFLKSPQDISQQIWSNYTTYFQYRNWQKWGCLLVLGARATEDINDSKPASFPTSPVGTDRSQTSQKVTGISSTLRLPSPLSPSSCHPWMITGL